MYTLGKGQLLTNIAAMIYCGLGSASGDAANSINEEERRNTGDKIK
jgi:hypothetical protein